MKLFLKVVAVFLLVQYFCVNLAFADVFHGHAEKNDAKFELQEELFTGKVETLEKTEVIEMTVSQVIDGEFSIEGDEFFAEVVNDVSGTGGILLPKGTVAHGLIRQTSEARRLGRDGYIDLSFDYLITPDGREIPIEGKMSTKMHPIKAATKIVATDVGYTAVGGVIGGFTALNLLGLEAAIASNGYTVMGGAAIGGAVGLGMSLYRKGKNVLISPGDQIRVKFKTNIPLPVYKDEALQQKEITCPGLNVRITNIKYEKDPFDQLNTITLSLSISNMSKYNFSSFDVALVNDYNSVFHPSVFGNPRMMINQIKSGDRVAGQYSFSVDNIKRRFWIVFYDRKTQKPLAKISIDNAYKNISEKTKKKNKKILKPKTNFYKQDDLLMFE